MVRLDPSTRIRPPCMDDADWAGWVRLDDSIGKNFLQATTPCVDCTVAYAAMMRTSGRCDKEPTVVARIVGRPRLADLEERIAHQRRIWRERSRRRRARRAAA